jgi:hypothetical protein
MDTQTTVAPLFNTKSDYLTMDELLEELEEQGIPLTKKQIDFRRKKW